jgi:hypothetical protein
VKLNFSIIINKRTRPGSVAAWTQTEALRRAKGAGTIRPSEYDFSGIPEDELEACVHYEYARESANVVQMAEELRGQLRDRRPKGNHSFGQTFNLPINYTKFTKTHAPMYDAWFLIALAGRDGFPTIAWQDLKPEDRQALKEFPGQAVAMHNKQLLKEHPVFVAEVVQDDGGLATVTLAAWEDKRMPALYRKIAKDKRRPWLLSGFMMVNLLHSPDEIVARFKEWLLKRHPRASKPPAEKRGRKSYRDRLNALGALRLRFYCRTLKEAQKTTTPPRDKRLFYSDRTAWNRACAQAVKYYGEVLDLPDTELPVHFTEGWQKKRRVF